MKQINKLVIQTTVDIEMSVVDSEKLFENEVDVLLGKNKPEEQTK